MLGADLADARRRATCSCWRTPASTAWTPSARPRLRERFAAFDHPAAREIVAWLDGACAIGGRGAADPVSLSAAPSSRAPCSLAAGGAALFAVRDRIPWPPLDVRFANGRDTPWQRLPQRSGLVEIAAFVNGAPIRAVVDSGAQFTAVDRALAERLGLPRIVAAPMLAYGVSGGPSLTHTVRLDLGVPGLVVPGLRAAALDLAGIAAASGRDFQLLIGRDVLSRLVVEVDFPRAAPASSPPASTARPTTP